MIQPRLQAASPWDRSLFRLVLSSLAFLAGPGVQPDSLRAEEEEPAAVSPEHAEEMKEGLELFTSKVRPILLQSCVECHGGESTKADFDLTTREALLASELVEVGNSAESWLMQVIRHEQEPHMPYKADKLSDEAIADLARWIDLGAPYDKPLTAAPTIAAAESEAAAPEANSITEADRQFWSFQPLALGAPPPVQQTQWLKTPIDNFVLAQLEKNKLSPNPLADRRTLIRRAYFDLIGLPPTAEEVEAFVADPDPAAYEKLLDRLLESPRYGERWARHWMDVARFAESHGYEQDYDRPHAYPYRDFLIKSLNADLPYDQFVRWQIAGDEFAPNDPLAISATGFLGAGPFPTQLTEAEFESARYDELDDMVRATTSAFLGLTVGCARCHDHKFDPFPAEDYYRLAATFTTTIRSEVPLTLAAGEQPTQVMISSEGLPPLKHHADERGFPHFYAQTYSLERGSVHQKKHVAEPGFLSVLLDEKTDPGQWKVEAPAGAKTSFRRAALANWIIDPNHGAGQLAARVIVNRLWRQHFGRGIVDTPDDFGFQGERPTHPELLDWLAADLIHHGWKLKRLHKLMMLSAAYTQSSDWDEARAQIDRQNVYLWRQRPRRLEGEAIRDAMLAVAGLLDQQMYGPGTLDPSMRRRSVYFFIKRSQLIPAMMLFDWPEPLATVGARSSTTIAPQALLFVNSPQARQSAEGFASRLKDLPAAEAVRRGHLMAIGREPSDRERELSAAFLAAQTERYQKEHAADANQRALVDFCQALLSMSAFVYVD